MDNNIAHTLVALLKVRVENIGAIKKDLKQKIKL